MCTSASKRTVIALSLSAFLASSPAHSQLTEIKQGEGAGPISGSAGPEGAAGAAVTLERCEKHFGTLAVVEPQDMAQAALRKFALPSPTGLIRLLVQQSGCFTVVERGLGFQNVMQERQITAAGEAARSGEIGRGQLVTADFVLTPDVAFKTDDAGGAGAVLGAIFGIVGTIIAAGMKFRQAQTTLALADTRTSVQVAASSGSAEKADFGIGGAIGGSSAVAALGAYENTPEGKVVAAAFLDAFNQMVSSLKRNPALVKPGEAPQPGATSATALGPKLQRGDILRARIGGAQVRQSPDERSKVVYSLTKQDEVIFLGDQAGDFLQVQGGFGRGWIESILVERNLSR